MIETRKMVRTLQRNNPKFVSINVVGETKYMLLPLGTATMEGVVSPCKDRRREMMLCAVETKMWKMHDVTRTLIKS